jgi:hypothetical protein
MPAHHPFNGLGFRTGAIISGGIAVRRKLASSTVLAKAA